MIVKSLFNYYNDLRIAKKLKFLSTSTAYISGFIVIVLFITFQYFDKKNEVKSEAGIFAKILADNVANSMILKDVLAISNTLASTEHNPKIRQAFAFDEKWHMLGAFHKGYDFYEKKQTARLIQNNKNLWHDGFYYCVVPILKDDVLLGHLVVVASLHEFYMHVIKNSTMIVIIIFFSLLLTYRFRRKLQEAILQPIAQLDKVTTEIVRTKKLYHKMPNFNQDEIGDLAKNFNYMLDALNAYQSELAAKKDILAYQATHDDLTKLPNRALFNDRLHQAIYKSTRYNQEFALIFLDLDEFKEVNDTFGHNCGDDLLYQVTKRLKGVLRDEDTLARLGGDEFIIILHAIKDKQAVSNVAEKILLLFKKPFEILEQPIDVSCSMGISLYPQDSNEASDLLKNADIAMYQAKGNGRNTYQFYKEEMSKKVYTRVAMQTQIRDAIKNREFLVYYQPQFNAKTEKIVGIEALVRWFHPQRGIVMPIEFIALSEDLGFIVDIGNYVLKEVMKQLVIWRNKALYFKKVSVNIAISQIETSDFIVLVERMLLETACEASWLVLEITEGQMMKNPDAAISTLKKLNSLGFEISIDDFGTGHSSLSYLKNLPIHELKIDRSFVQNIPRGIDDMIIIEAIIALSKSLNLNVVVEGVEREEQRDYLLSKECLIMQGYLLSYPLSVEEMTRLLTESLN